MIPRSIKGRLTYGVAITALLIMLASGWLIYTGAKRTTYKQIDANLLDHVELMARQVEFERGEIVLEHADRFETTPGEPNHGVFHVWINDGQSIARYPQLDDATFPRFGGKDTSFKEFTFPDGSPMRAISLRISPIYYPRQGVPDPPDLDATVQIAVAHNISAEIASINSIARLLITIGIVSFTFLVLGIHWLTRTALAPIKLVQDELSSRAGSDLALPIDSSKALPSELTPLVGSFNSLLSRIRDTSERERQFTSNAAHELRTPLSALTSILEQAVRRERSAQESKASFEKSLAMTRNMNQLVERLLTLARFDNSKFKMEVAEIPIEMLVEGAIETFQEIATARGLQIECHIPDDVTASADPALLQLVINNLLENAVNYADKDSRILISASNGGNQVRITVDNAAKGTNPESIKRVFEPFWREDKVRSHPGVHAGLGLSICQKIIALIGGNISARSAQDGQFRVLVELPASA